LRVVFIQPIDSFGTRRQRDVLAIPRFIEDLLDVECDERPVFEDQDESHGSPFGAFHRYINRGAMSAPTNTAETGTARNNLKFRAFKSLWARRRISWRNMNSADNRRPLADEVSNGR
jgi:hypothetical protein